MWPSLTSSKADAILRTIMHSDRSTWMGYSSNVEQGRGGLGSFKCFKSSKTVTSLQRAAKINPVTHTHTTTGKEKNGPCPHSPLARFFTSTWGKVEKYEALHSCYVACFRLYFVFVRVCEIHWVSLFYFACTVFESCESRKKQIMPMDVFTWCVQSTERPLVTILCVRVCVCVNCAGSVFSIFHSPLSSCSLYRLPLSVCPLGQRLWTSAMKRPLSGSGRVRWKIPTWTRQTLQLHENPASG